MRVPDKNQSYRIGPKRADSGMSLVELIISILVLGIVIALAVPLFSGVSEAGKIAKNQKNAQQLASVSTALASVGVAHVMPESLGGVEATARLIREGIIVPEGPFQGQEFKLASLSDEDITGASEYLEIVYDLHEIRLVLNIDD